jgi:hypothetical protein
MLANGSKVGQNNPVTDFESMTFQAAMDIQRMDDFQAAPIAERRDVIRAAAIDLTLKASLGSHQLLNDWHSYIKTRCTDLYTQLYAMQPEADKQTINDDPDLLILNGIRSALRYGARTTQGAPRRRKPKSPLLNRD